MRVWTRAVIVPAGRRVAAVWVACAIIAGQLFGGNALHPRDVTRLALANGATLAVLVGIWALAFLPTARVLVRQEGARWLRSLPAPVARPRLVAGLVFVGLQGPWLLLWTIGAHGVGLGVVAIVSVAIAAVAAIRGPTRAPRVPTWGGAIRGLVGVHLRALVRRGGDTLLRVVGLALLAGVAAGFAIANNDLHGRDAAVVGAAVLAIVLVPAQTPPLVALRESHGATAWLALSTGISESRRRVGLALAVIAVYGLATAVALVSAIVIAGVEPLFAITALACALGCGLGTIRTLVAPGLDTRVAARTAVGAFSFAAAAALAFGLVGLAGIPAILALGAAQAVRR